ncbi:MAG TPA: hypothetical protein EYP28_00165 [Methanophagales archaeon]|nr:hypothetical protein [Methanophagales archaeon]
MDEIIRKTIKGLENLDVNGTLSNVVITRIGPWTLSYVKYDDGIVGCGLANNELKIPEDVTYIRELLNLNVYEAMSKLECFENSVFINSLRASITSALSYRLMNGENRLKKEGYTVETYNAPNFPLFKPSKFVRSSDIVAMVGFHQIATPLCAEIAKEVNVTELMDLKELSVIDFDTEESNIKIKIFPVEKDKEVLSRADVVYITGETIVNGTIREILEISKNARTRIIYGPTSSFYPGVLFKEGVDISLPFIFPNTPDFRRYFVLSRGWWYFAGGIKQLLIKSSKVEEE